MASAQETQAEETEVKFEDMQNMANEKEFDDTFSGKLGNQVNKIYFHFKLSINGFP